MGVGESEAIRRSSSSMKLHAILAPEKLAVNHEARGTENAAREAAGRSLGSSASPRTSALSQASSKASAIHAKPSRERRAIPRIPAILGVVCLPIAAEYFIDEGVFLVPSAHGDGAPERPAGFDRKGIGKAEGQARISRVQRSRSRLRLAILAAGSSIRT